MKHDDNGADATQKEGAELLNGSFVFVFVGLFFTLAGARVQRNKSNLLTKYSAQPALEDFWLNLVSDELAPELCEVQGPDQEGGERRGSPPNINLELT